ncbi:MAG: helix-turn-helix domain-containing protein [Ruminococcaceae bacterium]|nr:helix-turn-helix domain-containing protein [Oscillospiraceae bacterium]
MNLIELIENYIVYLITECDLSVTLHPKETESLITFSPLMRFNIHDNSYCTCVKASAEGQARCLAQQEKVQERCREEKAEFCGICHAGVFEYVYPLSDGSRIIGFASVSGYAARAGEERIERTAERFDYSVELLKKAYGTLRPTPPDKKRIDTLVLPLCRMLELAYRREEGNVAKDSLITQILRYIHRNYATDLTSEEICRAFYCSRSHFSHIFKKETGKSFREYLTDVRMEDAKSLLRYSKLSVTEIALSVGFGDPNYFSNVFKRCEGCSPLAYRKETKL